MESRLMVTASPSRLHLLMLMGYCLDLSETAYSPQLPDLIQLGVLSQPVYVYLLRWHDAWPHTSWSDTSPKT